ncbi:MAG: hypothetical protein SFU86_20300 [Pirellulaceae bacterium]|nr:hypothetical protein [Pirellulaceae bacterium]
MSWALRLPPDSVRALGAIRRFLAVGICEANGHFWLRGQSLDEPLAALLRLVPGGELFRVGADGQLTASGELVPRGHLPAGPWQLLDEWLQVSFPTASDARASIAPLALQLIPSGEIREPAMLETTLSQLAEYLATTSQWRISRWSFAADRAGRAIIRGLPLPALPGVYWTLHDGIATPAGSDWSPAIEPKVLRQTLGLAENEIALLHPDGIWDRILPEDWTRASRSAVRNTCEALRV